jgi:Fusaric acid resistance protein-like
VRVAMETQLNVSRSRPVVQRLSLQDIAYSLELFLACLTTFWIIAGILRPLVESASDNLLGGMWAVVATVFVFRNTRDQSLSAGISRMIATCVSFVLCLAYLLFLPFNPVGMAALIGIGTLSTTLLGRRNEIVTTGITTAVVMVVAALSPDHAWRQPLLRLLDTIVGVTVGLTFAWTDSLFVRRWTGKFAEFVETDFISKGETNV